MAKDRFQLMNLLAAILISVVIGEKLNNGGIAYDIEVDLEKLIETQRFASGTSQNDPGSIDIAAFNVQVFGRTKMSKPFVADKLAQIILRYDLVLVQEIRDSSGTAINQLLNDVNSKSGPAKYAMVISERLGRTSSKEQYAFIYRSDLLTVARQYVYDDSANDIFQREPLVVKFTSHIAAISPFIAIGIHTEPSSATQEVDHLVDVYNDAVVKMNTNNAIIMGDFNAGCSYLSDWASVRLATDRRFYWLINDASDTTSKSTECAYDRFVVAGQALLDSVEPLATGVFRFDKHYKLTYEQAIKISDHYPIQMKIRKKAFQDNISQKRMIEILDEGVVTTVPTPPQNVQGVKVTEHFNKQGVLEEFILESSLLNKSKSGAKIDQLKSMMGELISTTQVNAAKRHLEELSMVRFLPKNNRYYQTLHDYYEAVPFLYKVMAHCKVMKKRCGLYLEVENAF